MAPSMTHHMMDTDTATSPERLRGATNDLFELLERVQCSRLDDQRCVLPAYFAAKVRENTYSNRIRNCAHLTASLPHDEDGMFVGCSTTTNITPNPLSSVKREEHTKKNHTQTGERRTRCPMINC